MWDRLLIANRGEIAVRVARTARSLGISPVGVYAPPDTGAFHTQRMDTAVRLSGNSLAETYLSTAAIIEAAERTGCEAVHPGYGFLSENPEAAEAIITAGLSWIGPTPSQIRRLGDKLAVKQLAAELGVPTTVPVAVNDTGQDFGELDFPLLVKAAGGGGGRGMVVVRHREELPQAITQATNRAQTDFGDPRVFLEPLIEAGRHIEVQILGDRFGNLVHLGERDCSIQRRNQKIIEEAPAPGLSEQVRHQLWDGALRLGSSVDYESVGTVEFMVGAEDRIALLEVNTRLQVEHPVTEAITGLDLVECQLRVAADQPLGFTQSDIVFSGAAIETRLVAEDPQSQWLPVTGRIRRFGWDRSVRVDAGVGAGSMVTEHYDSLLAKVIAHAPDRQIALRVLRQALRSAHLSGPKTNRDALVAILSYPEMIAGSVTTSFLSENPNYPSLPQPDSAAFRLLLIAAVVVNQRRQRQADRHWPQLPSGWRNLPSDQGERSTWTDTSDRTLLVEENWFSSHTAHIRLGEWPTPHPDDGVLSDDRRLQVKVVVLEQGSHRLSLEVDGVSQSLLYSGNSETGITVTGPEGGNTFTLQPRFRPQSSQPGGGGPRSPLPGVVLSVAVTEGQLVEADQLLMVIEAMKMEHRITAAEAGQVQQVRFATGERVDVGDLLVEISSSAEPE